MLTCKLVNNGHLAFLSKNAVLFRNLSDISGGCSLFVSVKIKNKAKSKQEIENRKNNISRQINETSFNVMHKTRIRENRFILLEEVDKTSFLIANLCSLISLVLQLLLSVIKKEKKLLQISKRKLKVDILLDWLLRISIGWNDYLMVMRVGGWVVGGVICFFTMVIIS